MTPIICKKCGIGRDAAPVDPHHILPRKKYPYFIDAPENIVYLCQNCHRMLHWKKWSIEELGINVDQLKIDLEKKYKKEIVEYQQKPKIMPKETMRDKFFEQDRAFNMKMLDIVREYVLPPHKIGKTLRCIICGRPVNIKKSELWGKGFKKLYCKCKKCGFGFSVRFLLENLEKSVKVLRTQK